MKVCLTIVTLFLCSLPSTRPAPFPDKFAAESVTVFPSRIGHHGEHVSFNLLSSDISDDDEHNTQHYFKLEAFGRHFVLNVSDSAPFISSRHAVEYHRDGQVTRVRTSLPSSTGCHLSGTAHEVDDAGHKVDKGWVAVSNCRGLHGAIATSSGYLYIEPMGVVPADPHTHAHQHIVYRQSSELRENGHCAYESKGDSGNSPHVPWLDESTIRLSRSLEAATTSSQHYLEVAVVADRTMADYHGITQLEAYLFTLMNMVSHLYRHPSIGHAINIVLVRTIILESDQAGLSITSNALNSLNSFCTWQSSNPPSSGAGQDVTVLITRTDICEGFGGKCGTLGIAEFKGACTPQKSCSISEDIGLATAFTIAHEIGHNLGIHHDGDMSVMCEPDDHYIMAPSFAQSRNPHYWSHCSRQQLAEFLQSPQSSCLSNEPLTQDNGSSLLPLPGLDYTPTEQCQLLLGEQASHCSNNTDLCSLLWCRENNQSDCNHQNIPPAPGTECTLTSGRGGVCYQGSCVEYENLSRPVDGGWGEWGEWEECSLTCGMGVQSSSRTCDSPVPANGGRYCLGVSQRYQTCNTHSCPDSGDIRQQLCKEEPPHSRYREWQAPTFEYLSRRGLDQCTHHCLGKPNDILFTLMLSLPDGTPCLYSSDPPPEHSLQLSTIFESRGVCVSGECVPVGCDNVLNHMASRDACGLWCGNGSTCVSVSDTYTIPGNNTVNGNYVYHKAVTLPRGSGHIQISELQSTDNLYLAAMTDTENFNGNYRVKNGELASYWFAGAKWWYERPDGGIECLRTAGILKDDVTIFAIVNAMNLSIRYSAGIPSQNASDFVRVGYVWREGEWGECDGECGEGVRRRAMECVFSDSGVVVNDSHCETDSKPRTEEVCHTEDGCRYQWRIYPWTECNAVCGAGEISRQIACILTNNNSFVSSHYCGTGNIPATSDQCYSEQGCVFEWQAGEWSDCSSACGVGERTREVACLLTNNNTDVTSDYCDSSTIPERVVQCYTETGCVFEWQAGEWSHCSSACGVGERTREVACLLTNNNTDVASDHCDSSTIPERVVQCYTETDCVFEWQVREWGDCSTSCGQGHRERNVSCILPINGTIVSDIHCTNKTLPGNKSYCYSEESCGFEWRASVWSKCTSQCGLGERTRNVSCFLINNATVVQDKFCGLVSRPVSQTVCYSEEGCVYEWQEGVWSSCDADCGMGERVRDVSCVLTNNGTTVSNKYCEADEEPDSISECYAEDGCKYEWQYGNWTPCSMECGQGFRTREVTCYLTNNNTRVSDHRCPGNTTPISTTQCYSESGCVFEWTTEPWSECSVTCGEGYKTRDVLCAVTSNDSRVEDHHCSSEGRPAVRTPCYTEQGCQFVWHTTPWGVCNTVCGEGERRRNVTCVLVNNATTVDKTYCGIESEPVEVSVCGEECLFEWRAGEWGGCASGSCEEEGRRWREVACVLVNNQSLVDDSFCNLGGKPSVSSSCPAQECQYRWVVGGWGVCDAGCGEGVRVREVHCELVNGREGKRKVDRGRCGSLVVPHEKETCLAEPCLNFKWSAGNWTECDAECGETGSQNRTVVCQHRNGTMVLDSPYCTWSDIPETVRSCQGQPCVEPCVDSPYSACQIIVKVRLCRYQSFYDLCCHSCSSVNPQVTLQ